MTSSAQMPTVAARQITTPGGCGWCDMTADLCAVLAGPCCPDCTHYDEPIDLGPDDLDEIAIERALRGDKSITLTRAETAEVWRRCEAKGMSAAEIGDLLGTTGRSVQRWRDGQAKPISRPAGGRGMSQIVTTTEDETAAMLRKAIAHPSKRVQNAAKKAQEAVEHVRALLADEDGKRAARERVERLERELREAKAALRGGAVTPTSPLVDLKAVRAWAIANGYEVAPVGRIPQSVIEDYQRERAAS